MHRDLSNVIRISCAISPAFTVDSACGVAVTTSALNAGARGSHSTLYVAFTRLLILFFSYNRSLQ